MHLERAWPVNHRVVIVPSGGVAHVEKTNDDGGGEVSGPDFSVVPFLTHPVPLILSALLVTFYMPGFGILMNIATKWSQTLTNLQFSKRF